MKKDSSENGSGLGPQVSRRDFIGGTLIGAGAGLLYAPAPASAQQLGRAWTGYGGVGDYQRSNGNTASVVEAAHKIRDGGYKDDLKNAVDTGQTYDLVVVGAGFSGMSAAYEFSKAKPHGTCLMIDNHAIFGGEAKQNEFDVDGYRLTGPQGPNSHNVPKTRDDPYYNYWHELEMPTHFELARREGGDSSIVFAQDNFAPMYWAESTATVGYYFQNALTGGKGQWVKDIWADDLKRAPLASDVKKDLLAWRKADARRPGDHSDPRWLDTMTYADLATKVLGLGREGLRYADPLLATGTFAASSDVLSAYAAYISEVPSVSKNKNANMVAEDWYSCPGGNTTLLRHLVKAVFPAGITGPKRFDAIANNPVDFSALDRDGAARRMRLNSTLVRVSHDGDAATADHVNVVYAKGGTLYSVRARAAVLSIGSWVGRYVVADLPDSYRKAFDNFYHGPIMSVNVALHNWRFLDKLGISAAHWFEGFGFFANVRQPMLVGDRPTPFHPDKPAVLTFYVPFVKQPTLPIAAQGPAGRMELYGTSYADYERQIVGHMQRLFAVGGFEPRRDIAGIVLNRWGHAFISPQPGFYFGKDGQPAPREIIRKRFGRIAFGHCELQGVQSRIAAMQEGTRAFKEVLEVL